MKKNKKWTPVLDGAIYCSPSCGGHCTKAAYDAAVAAANKLAFEMGPKWKPHVWENLGWHYSVVDVSGHWKIHRNGNTFTAYLGDCDEGGRWAKTAKTPWAAVAMVKKEAFADLCMIVDFLSSSGAHKTIKKYLAEALGVGA
jgi:hypothetical protein